jgi:hypothetical protein
LNTGTISFEAGLSTQSDRQKYNYIQAYRGPNDYIKVNKVEGDKNKAEYLVSIGFIPYLYADKTVHHLVNTYFRTGYELEGLKLSGLVRRDGSSKTDGFLWSTRQFAQFRCGGSGSAVYIFTGMGQKYRSYVI